MFAHQADAYYQRIWAHRSTLRESSVALRRLRRARKFLWQRDTGTPRELMGSPPGAQYGTPERAGCPRQGDLQVHGLTAAGCARKRPEKRTSGQARARRISPARTTSRRPRSADCRSTATDHRTVPTDRRWFVRRRGLVGTHPTAENLDRSSETSGAPLSLLMRSPVR